MDSSTEEALQLLEPSVQGTQFETVLVDERSNLSNLSPSTTAAIRDGSQLSSDELNVHPALEIRKKTTLDIDPFPKEILSKVNVTYSFKPAEKDGDLIVPLMAVYKCVFDDAPAYLEEKAEVWAGSEYGKTHWLTSKRLGKFPTPADSSLIQRLQGKEGAHASIEALETLTGNEFAEGKARTVGRYIASLVNAGDNHITLLTAAYCVLFDTLWGKALKAERRSMSSLPAEHLPISSNTDWEIIWQNVNKPIIVVNANPRYVNFWKMVCGDGVNYANVFEAGGKTFCSPWAMLGFKGLLNALIVTEVEPYDGDLDFLEMQEAIEDYIVQHRLYAQAEASSRLASRLPWLVKYNFVDTMPTPIHSADLLRGTSPLVAETLPSEDITFKLPPRFTIGTLLLAGHLLETRFNHWLTKTIDFEIEKISTAAAYRKLFYAWEIGSRAHQSPWDTPDMKEIDEVMKFLGYIRYSRRGDLKFRSTGINTSYWEAAVIGPTAQTSAHAVLMMQEPQPTFVGGTLISVNSAWFAKIRASDLFGKRIFNRPYTDFPFPTDKLHAGYLTEIEQRLALVQKTLPAFELISLQFGRNRPSYPFPTSLMDLVPVFPPGVGAHRTGTFRDQFLFPNSKDSHEEAKKLQVEWGNMIQTEVEANAGEDVDENDLLLQYLKVGWRRVVPPSHGAVHVVHECKDAALLAFAEAVSNAEAAVTLEKVKGVARELGWNDEICLNVTELGRLSRHFGVEIILEDELTGCFIFPATEGAPSIHMIYFEDKRFGWVEKQMEEDSSVKKRVKAVSFV